MSKDMTPSEVKAATAEQINKAVANYRTMLEKHAPQFQAAPFQTVLGQSEFARAQFELLRSRVEAASSIIIRRVKVDRSRSPRKVVSATGRTEYYIDDKVLATMPEGEDGEEVDVWFIPTKRYVHASEVPTFLAQYGLVPDPRAQAAVNEADPAFADEHPNVSQWGYNCCLAFSRWGGKRALDCRRHDGGWHDGWSLAGVPDPRSSTHLPVHVEHVGGKTITRDSSLGRRGN